MSFNIDTAKSYATEANLRKALIEKGYNPERVWIVRNRAGRWTAVFNMHIDGVGAYPAHDGFLVLG